MQRFRSRWAAKGVLLAAAALATAAGAWGATTTRGAAHSSKASATLVVDRSFEIKTADPQRAFEPTAAIVDRGIYDTFFTYRGNDLAHPIPLLVRSWTASKNAKTFVFHLRTNVYVFASLLTVHDFTSSGIGWTRSPPLYVNRVS